MAAGSVVAGVARAQTGSAAAAPVPTTDVPDLQRLLYDTAARPDQREQAAQRPAEPPRRRRA